MKELEQDQREKIISVLADLADVSADKITEDTKLKDGLGMDSLDIVEAVMKLEEEFDCSIPDEDYEFAKTVGDVFKIVANRIN